MFNKIIKGDWKGLLGGDDDDNSNNKNSSNTNDFVPYNFDKKDDGYIYPNVYEEADEMLQVSNLIYTITDVRTIAKKHQQQQEKLLQEQASVREVSLRQKLQLNATPSTMLLSGEGEKELVEEGEEKDVSNYDTPSSSSLGRILQLPLRFETCVQIIDNNMDCIVQAIGNEDSQFTKNSLQTIKQRYQQETNDKNKRNNKEEGQPVLVAYGDENPEKELVYAIGTDPMRKRITLAFRGSVTVTDFFTDSMIFMNQQPNPLLQKTKTDDSVTTNIAEIVGIHHGFYEYMFNNSNNNKSETATETGNNDDKDDNNEKDNNKDTTTTTDNDNNDQDKEKNNENGSNNDNKYFEILNILLELFQKHPDYKLYVTGHSLGGALATLFSFYLSATIASSSSSSINNKITLHNNKVTLLPLPISCVSIASPLVGDRRFQQSFQYLEYHGYVRHLRVANDRDPVTIMPQATVKKIWAMLSPASYLAFKLSDGNFEENQTYHHTGLQLKLLRMATNKTKDETTQQEETPQQDKEDMREKFKLWLQQKEEAKTDDDNNNNNNTSVVDIFKNLLLSKKNKEEKEEAKTGNSSNDNTSISDIFPDVLSLQSKKKKETETTTTTAADETTTAENEKNPKTKDNNNDDNNNEDNNEKKQRGENDGENRSSSSSNSIKYDYELRYSGCPDCIQTCHSTNDNTNTTSTTNNDKTRAVVSNEDNDKKNSEDKINNLLDTILTSLTPPKVDDIPDVTFHMGTIYCDNLINVKDDLTKLTLNQLYQLQHQQNMVDNEKGVKGVFDVASFPKVL